VGIKGEVTSEKGAAQSSSGQGTKGVRASGRGKECQREKSPNEDYVEETFGPVEGEWKGFQGYGQRGQTMFLRRKG